MQAEGLTLVGGVKVVKARGVTSKSYTSISTHLAVIEV